MCVDTQASVTLMNAISFGKSWIMYLVMWDRKAGNCLPTLLPSFMYSSDSSTKSKGSKEQWRPENGLPVIYSLALVCVVILAKYGGIFIMYNSRTCCSLIVSLNFTCPTNGHKQLNDIPANQLTNLWLVQEHSSQYACTILQDLNLKLYIAMLHMYFPEHVEHTLTAFDCSWTACSICGHLPQSKWGMMHH